MLDSTKIESLGDALYDALRSGRPTQKISALEPESDIEDAYRIQLRMLERRLEAGDEVVGKKIGLTSRAIQDALGVYQPDFGQVTKRMLFEDGATIDLSKLMQPRLEGELAFRLKEDLIGPGVTVTDVIRATDYVTPCFEIVDTRYQDWQIKIQDTVADNASCGVFVLGEAKADPRDLDLSLAGMVIEKNGEVVATGAGAAVQGSPVMAVAWLANTLGRLGIPLKAGEIILSGAQAPLLAVTDGDHFTCEIAGIGACEMRFAGRAMV
ncbi:fumarylacetoacetate hydrolase family protein [Thioclava sediminum]|uniref:fumarylacetoacetate hydrolase family protein n=1 Tax=Thioclava sediminum TaxID=1915319 RepID=UPI00244C53E3|nr:fumarylacetoacetate hydrolase family protein [Thioclava sediminum]